MPPNVKLLCFDTTSRSTSSIGSAYKGSRVERNEEDIRVGEIQLTEGTEFVPIGENIATLLPEIASGKHPHLQWFPAKSFISKLPPAAFNIKEGSGQIRHMGRIALFNDLRQHSRILSKIRAALQDLQGNVSRDQQMEIIIVSSLAGGTGAGMLVDMALLVRGMAYRVVVNNYVVRGFFVLPSAFISGGLGEGRDMLARAFATWRELDRFMIWSERLGTLQMNYHEFNSDLRFRIERRAYDVSYIVDPARVINSLDNIRPEEGVFPAIAQVIATFLDEKASHAYTEFVTTNLAGKLAQLPRRPYYSAIGSYTLKVPAYYAKTKFAHQLALAVMQEFLALEVNDDRMIINVSEIRNREASRNGSNITRAVLKFMATSGLNINGKEIPNTDFLPLVAEIRTQEGLSNNTLAQQIARGGFTRGRSRLLAALTNIGQDEEGNLILQEINDELNLSVLHELSSIASTDEMANTLFSVQQMRQEHYGIDTTSGERLRGKYGKALERAKQAQVTRFRRLLQGWTFNILNGISDDYLRARSGKVGYLRAFYQELDNIFNYFIKFINEVRRIRNEELRLAAKTRETVNASLQKYQRLVGKKDKVPFWDVLLSRARKNYLLAEQRDIDVRKDDILLDVLAETAIEMRSITEKALDEVQSWIIHLVTGDPNRNIEGLYPALRASLSNINAYHDLDKRLSKVSELIGEHEYQPQEEHIREMLSRLKWQVEETQDGGLRLTCGIDFPSNDPNLPAGFYALRRDNRNSTLANMGMLLSLCQRPYEAIYEERPIAREIMKVYPTGTALAEKVDHFAEPLYLPATAARGPEVVACYIRVHSNLDEKTASYFREFEYEMKARNPQIKGSNLTLVDSEDLYKMTIVRSDDLIRSEDFQMWHVCREAYIQQVTDPQRGIPAQELHIFPAEINACEYEQAIPKLLGKNYRVLHPEVVALLEDKERFEIFVHAYALGLIKRVESSEGISWICKIPGQKEPVHLANYRRYEQEDIFEVIVRFEGGIIRTAAQNVSIDWEKFSASLVETRRRIGKIGTVARYRRQIEASNGLVELILTKVSSYRTIYHLEQTELARPLEDIADLITIVCIKEIQFLESLDYASLSSGGVVRDLMEFAQVNNFRIVSIKETPDFDIVELIAETEKISKVFPKPILGCQISSPVTESILMSIASLLKENLPIRNYPNVILVGGQSVDPAEFFEIAAVVRARTGLDFRLAPSGAETVSSELIEIAGSRVDLYAKVQPDTTHFFGREAIMASLRDRLLNCEVIGLWGIRKIGKTSLMHRLREEATFPIAYVDLQARGEIDELFKQALQSWYESARRLRIIWDYRPIRSNNIATDFVSAVDRLYMSTTEAGKGIPVLMIDEIELILPEEPDSHSLNRYRLFSERLRGLVQERKIGLLFAGVNSAIGKINYFGSRQNPFYQFVSDQYLGPISKRDCREMIVGIGHQMMLSYSDDAVNAIVDASGGHPFLARQICSRIYKSLPSGQYRIEKEQAEGALKWFIRNSDSLGPSGLWGELTNPVIWGEDFAKSAKRILRLVAQKGVIERDEIIKKIVDAHITPFLAETTLLELENRGVLTHVRDEISICFDIFRQWIERYQLYSEE